MQKRAHITGTGGYQPGEPIPTSKIQELVGELIPEVAEGLSIEQRFWQIDIETGEHRENNSDLSYKAAVAALESAGVEPGRVELIIRATGTPDFPLPPVVNQVQERVFGDDVTVHRPQLKLGEPMGVGGALNAALALKSWEGGEAGPVLVNSLSLGATNFSIALGPFAG